MGMLPPPYPHTSTGALGRCLRRTPRHQSMPRKSHLSVKGSRDVASAVPLVPIENPTHGDVASAVPPYVDLVPWDVASAVPQDTNHAQENPSERNRDPETLPPPYPWSLMYLHVHMSIIRQFQWMGQTPIPNQYNICTAGMGQIPIPNQYIPVNSNRVQLRWVKSQPRIHMVSQVTDWGEFLPHAPKI